MSVQDLFAENEDLKAENAALKTALALARTERDSVVAQLTDYRRYYTRTGW